MPTIAMIIVMSTEIASKRRYVTVAFPASATPLAGFGAADPWEVDIGYEVNALWKPLTWTVDVRERWVAVVEPNVPGPARRPEEVFRGAPPVSSYLRPHLERKRAELKPSWLWRLGLSMIDDESLEAITLDMVASGESERGFFVLWQLPVAIGAVAVVAGAVYFTIAAVARERKRVAVELAASASRTGKCPECDYPTVGLGSGICPECGWDHDRLKRRLTVLRRRYQRRLWTESGQPVHVYFR
ncbi:MAG: hypothetical protein HEQ23_14800 [Tepidisphaera sp.]